MNMKNVVAFSVRGQHALALYLDGRLFMRLAHKEWSEVQRWIMPDVEDL